MFFNFKKFTDSQIICMMYMYNQLYTTFKLIKPINYNIWNAQMTMLQVSCSYHTHSNYQLNSWKLCDL